jgi:2-keto-4-pentenoate hydratase
VGDRSMADEEAADAAERHIAQSFVAARAARLPLADYPGRMPASLAAAYRIQGQAIALRGGTVAGWKVGRIHAPASVTFGADRLAGPIFTDQICHESAAGNRMPVIAAGFAAAEAEIVLKVGVAPACPEGMTLEATAGCIAAAHIGIEIASSPFAQINECGPAVTASDFGNNFGLLIGAAIPDWRALAFEQWQIESRIDGVSVGRGTPAAMPDGVLGAARFLFANLAARGIVIAPGSWISTGAVTGVHPVRPGQFFEADFVPGLRLACHLDAAVSQTPAGAPVTARETR